MVLHDLPQKYAQTITFYDREGNFTTHQHVDRFNDFIDLEEVDYDDAKVSLFSQSLSVEEKKWFKYLPARSIHEFDGFQTLFLDRWEDKNNPLQILAQYNNLKNGNFESINDFSSRFMRVYNSIPADITPLVGVAKLHYPHAFDNDLPCY